MGTNLKFQNDSLFAIHEFTKHGLETLEKTRSHLNIHEQVCQLQ